MTNTKADSQEALDAYNRFKYYTPPYSFSSVGFRYNFYFDGGMIFSTMFCSKQLAKTIVECLNTAYFEGWLQHRREQVIPD